MKKFAFGLLLFVPAFSFAQPNLDQRFIQSIQSQQSPILSCADLGGLWESEDSLHSQLNIQLFSCQQLVYDNKMFLVNGLKTETQAGTLGDVTFSTNTTFITQWNEDRSMLSIRSSMVGRVSDYEQDITMSDLLTFQIVGEKLVVEYSVNSISSAQRTEYHRMK